MTTTAELTEIVEKKIKDLPPLPLVVQKLVKTLDDENSSADDVMKVLTADQALASKVLKLVNSSFYGMSGEVATPSRAVVILGFAVIRNLAVGLSVAKFMSVSDDNNHMQRFWDQSIATAAACQMLAKRTGYSDPEEAFIAGLLHNIGHMVLNAALPTEYLEVIADGPEHILANEQKYIGLGHAEAGQMLLNHWKLPRSLSSAVRFHHNAKVYTSQEDPLVSLVALADAFACVYGAVYERTMNDDDLLAVVKTTGLDLETVGEMLAELETRVDETRVFLQIATDEEVEPAEHDDAGGAGVAMICTDAAKMTWARQIFDYYGVTSVATKAFFSNPDVDNELDFVVLDAASVSAEQLQKMKQRLIDTTVPIMLLGGDPTGIVSQTLGLDLPTIPLTFTKADFAWE